MIVVRTVFQAKWGKADELVRAVREGQQEMIREAGIRGRILTDLGGQFFTVVLEGEFASLAAWEQFRARMFQDSRFQQSTAQGESLIESGRQEFFTVVAEI
jgi:hypothetical protein